MRLDRLALNVSSCF